MAEAILGFVGLAISVASLIELSVKTTSASLKFLGDISNAGRDFVLSRYWLTRYLDRYKKFLEFWSISDTTSDQRFVHLWGADGKRQTEASLEVLKLHCDIAQHQLENAGKGLMSNGGSQKSLKRRILGKVRMLPKNDRITSVDENEAETSVISSSASGKDSIAGNTADKWQLAFDAMSIQSGATAFRRASYVMESKAEIQHSLDEIGKCLDALIKDAELLFFTQHPEVSQGNLSVSYIKRIVTESEKNMEFDRKGDVKGGELTRNSTLYSTAPPEMEKTYELVLCPPPYEEEDSSGEHALTVTRRFTEAPPGYAPRFVVNGSQLTIESKHLMSILRQVVKYYPSHDLSYDTLVLEEPYHLLVHIYPDLREHYTESGLAGEEQDHLKQLLEFVKGDRGKDIAKMEEMQSKAAEECSFDDFWLLCRPGTIVVTKSGHLHQLLEQRALAIHSTEYQEVPIPERSFGTRKVFKVLASYIDYDGTYYVRRLHHFTLPSFEGKHRITEMPIYPIALHGDAAGVIKSLWERGQKYCRLVRSYQLQEYSFWNPSGKEESSIERVMIDCPLYHSLVVQEWDIVKTGRPTLGFVDSCQCRICSHTRLSLEESRRELNDIASQTRTSPTSFAFDETDVNLERFRAHTPPTQTFFNCLDTPEMLLLLPFHIRGFLLKQLIWADLHIFNLRDPRFDIDSWDNVVLSEDERELLLSIAELGDVYGNGVLFQGAPGTGKTHTAVCFAEYTRKPLINIHGKDIRQLGIETNAANANLGLAKSFKELAKLANLWGAILLIEDANGIFDAEAGKDARDGLSQVFTWATNPIIIATNLFELAEENEAFIAKLSLVVGFVNTESMRKKIFSATLGRLPPGTMSDDEKENIVSKWAGAGRLDGHAIARIADTAIKLAARKGENLELKHIELVIQSHGSWEANSLRGLKARKESQARLQQESSMRMMGKYGGR